VLIPDKWPGYLLLIISTAGFIVEMMKQEFLPYYKYGAIVVVLFMSLFISYQSLARIDGRVPIDGEKAKSVTFG